ncbi:MAG: glycosyltransferase family 2 protein [Deltaproteobacteria bacterium]|nr:MAG: glycosyltransferase family 2 protein [Deltaproteobacteria bacterium]
MLSVIIPTLERTTPLKRLLDSLSRQTALPGEIIIIDENNDDRTLPIRREFDKILPLKHAQIETVSISAAKNRGVALSSGELLFFCDDDAWLPTDFVEETLQFFFRFPETSILSLPVVDPSKEIHTAGGKEGPAPLTLKNARKLSTGSGLVFRRESLISLGLFDEDLGVGSTFESSEDLDIVLRAISRGMNVVHWEGTCVYHADPLRNYDEVSRKRAYRYNRGFGACVRKHLLEGNREIIFEFLAEASKNLLNSVLYIPINYEKAAYNYFSFLGKVNGFFSYSPGGNAVTKGR